MPQLNPGGLSTGFLQGLAASNSIADRKRQEARDVVNDQRYAEQSERQNQQFDMQRQQFDASMENSRLDRAERGEDRQRAQDMDMIKTSYIKLSQPGGADLLSDAELQAMQRQAYMSPVKVMSPEVGQAVDTLSRVIDGDDELQANDPDAVKAANTLFAERLGDGKRIVGVYPGSTPETVTLDLEVDGPDGKPYNAPMTRNRGVAGEDDDVLEVPIESIVNHVAGFRAMRQALSSPEAQANVKRMGEAMGIMPREDSFETVNGPGGAMFQRNTRTGQMTPLLGRAPQQSASSSRYDISRSTELQYQQMGKRLEQLYKQKDGKDELGAPLAQDEQDALQLQINQLEMQQQSLMGGGGYGGGGMSVDALANDIGQRLNLGGGGQTSSGQSGQSAPSGDRFDRAVQEETRGLQSLEDQRANRTRRSEIDDMIDTARGAVNQGNQSMGGMGIGFSATNVTGRPAPASDLREQAEALREAFNDPAASDRQRSNIRALLRPMIKDGIISAEGAQ